ncbi:uncharacterized protein LOC110433011 isoform X2 [Sorghum bicolor]|nr:uncharacterized protein LOC110433011 isoform X2 [Sorghum bicolor]|eukprot:XP_021310196.1 uncharacterized protein LOC110433011 isoform X2 [Sorghum bicolor]
MRHKLEELDIVEWHYLVMYFGSEEFQRISNKNSRNRHNKKINHVTGSKSFSQLSYEKRYPLTGDEPNDLDLFMMTHTKNGDWTSQESRDVYDNASNKLSERETNGDINIISDVEQNHIFQVAYKETTNYKSTKIHANGYMAKYPTRRQLLSEEYQFRVRQDATLMEAFAKLQERIETQEAERQAKREEHRRQIEEMEKAREADREALKQEFMSMMQAIQGQTSLPQGDKEGEIAELGAETNMFEGNVTTRENEEISHQQDNPHSSLLQTQLTDATGITTGRTSSTLETQLASTTPATTANTRTTRSAVNKSKTAQNKGGNLAVSYTNTKALKDDAAKKRAFGKRKEQAGSVQEQDGV